PFPFALPPAPPVAFATTPIFSLLLVGELVPSSNERYEPALPAMPAVPLSFTEPPAPPIADCDRLSVAPAVEPLTALRITLSAPRPAFAPLLAAPPVPPVCVAFTASVAAALGVLPVAAAVAVPPSAAVTPAPFAAPPAPPVAF